MTWFHPHHAATHGNYLTLRNDPDSYPEFGPIGPVRDITTRKDGDIGGVEYAMTPNLSRVLPNTRNVFPGINGLRKGI